MLAKLLQAVLKGGGLLKAGEGNSPQTELQFRQIAICEFCTFQKIDRNPYNLPGLWGVLTEAFFPFSKELGKESRKSVESTMPMLYCHVRCLLGHLSMKTVANYWKCYLLTLHCVWIASPKTSLDGWKEGGKDGWMNGWIGVEYFLQVLYRSRDLKNI